MPVGHDGNARPERERVGERRQPRQRRERVVERSGIERRDVPGRGDVVGHHRHREPGVLGELDPGAKARRVVPGPKLGTLIPSLMTIAPPMIAEPFERSWRCRSQRGRSAPARANEGLRCISASKAACGTCRLRRASRRPTPSARRRRRAVMPAKSHGGMTQCARSQLDMSVAPGNASMRSSRQALRIGKNFGVCGGVVVP